MNRMGELAESLVLSGYDSLLSVDQILLDTIPAAVYVCAADGTIVRFNRRAVDLWGRAPARGDRDQRFCGALRLYLPDGTPLPHARTPMARVLETGERAEDLQVLMERPDGTRITVLVNIGPLRDAKGNVVGAINCFQDVTERVRAEAALRDQEHRFRQLLDALPAAVYTTDAEGVVSYYNRAAAEFAGRTPAVGEDKWCVAWRLYRDDGSELPHSECPMAVSLREQRPVRNVEVVAERPDGTRVPVMPFPTPLFDANGRFLGGVNVLVDISEGKKARVMAERRAEEQAILYRFTDGLCRAGSLEEVYDVALAAIIEAAGCRRASVLLFDDQGVMQFVAWRGLSDEYRTAVAGHTPWVAGEIDPKPITVPDVAASDLEEDIKTLILGEGIGALAFIPVTSGGRTIGKFMTYFDEPHDFGPEEIDLSLAVARQLGFGIEQKRWESSRELLVAELSHRVKNTLATVSSVARLSFGNSSSVEEARRSFEGRIRAMAQAHSRLAQANWSGVSLGTLLADELSPFLREDGSNVRCSGDPVTLNSKAAVVLSMAFHELATNAAKYGALSEKDGHVDVSWMLGPERRLTIQWRESGGPEVKAPKKGGFGRLLLEKALAVDVQGAVQLAFAPEGLSCDIEFTLEPAHGAA